MTRSESTVQRAVRHPLPTLGVAVFLAFGVSLLGDFVYDDDILIRENPTVKDSDLFVRSVFGSLFANTIDEGDLAFFRPLVLSSHFITYQLVGLTPWVFHLTNLAFHLLNGLLVYHLARLWFGLRSTGALVAALVFLVHPIQTEPVAWISGRTDTMCATGILGTLLFAWQ